MYHMKIISSLDNMIEGTEEVLGLDLALVMMGVST